MDSAAVGAVRCGRRPGILSADCWLFRAAESGSSCDPASRAGLKRTRLPCGFDGRDISPWATAPPRSFFLSSSALRSAGKRCGFSCLRFSASRFLASALRLSGGPLGVFAPSLESVISIRGEMLGIMREHTHTHAHAHTHTRTHTRTHTHTHTHTHTRTHTRVYVLTQEAQAPV